METAILDAEVTKSPEFYNEDGTAKKSHFIRRKDGEFYNYPNKAAEARPAEFEMVLCEEDRLKVLRGEDELCRQHELDEIKRKQDTAVMQAIHKIESVLENVVLAQAQLQVAFERSKKEGAQNVDRNKIVFCDTYASGLNKTPTRMTKEEIIYSAYHKFSVELNPYADVKKLKSDYKSLMNKEAERKGEEFEDAPPEEKVEGRRMLTSYPKKAPNIETMQMAEIIPFVKKVFGIDTDDEFGIDFERARALKLKAIHYAPAEPLGGN